MQFQPVFVADKVLSRGVKVARLGEWFRLTQEEWSEMIGVSRSTIASYKNVDGKDPHKDKVKEWALRFGVPVEWFYSQDDDDPPIPRDPDEAQKKAALDLDGSITPIHPDDLSYEEEDFTMSEMVKIPVWQGVMTNLDETHFTEEKRPIQMDAPKFFFSRKKLDRFIMCLPKGRSMAPRIISPDRVISLLTPEAPPNSLVVARRDDGINFIKVLRVDRMGNKELHSINPDFPPITKLEDWVLRAAVVGIWKPYMMDGPNIEFNGGMPLRA